MCSEDYIVEDKRCRLSELYEADLSVGGFGKFIFFYHDGEIYHYERNLGYRSIDVRERSEWIKSGLDVLNQERINLHIY